MNASVPAAEYVRMSDEAQQYSIANQKAAIRQYAHKNGFSIIKTYADAGKSGVVAGRRAALMQLLTDVMSGRANYKAILVYDVSRWGRYQNTDEAAHYEFLCASAGIPLHYCGELFTNDGNATGALMKALKRTMAAEFSRDLSAKVFRGKSRLVQLGYWVGGPPGYGYRRLMISADGKPKSIMKPGEQKSFTTDRVILVPGPHKEVAGVNKMFSMAVQGLDCGEIARQMNARGFFYDGRPWNRDTVNSVVRNPKYVGRSVWYRTSQKLHTRKVSVSPDHWIVKERAFEALVDEAIFERAQRALPRACDFLWTKEEIIESARKLLRKQGRLSDELFTTTPGVPKPITVRQHFHGFRGLYELLGYGKADHYLFRAEQCQRSLKLRDSVFASLQQLFPEHVTTTISRIRGRSMLFVDQRRLVSVLLSRQKRKGHLLFWEVAPAPAERACPTLVCFMNPSHDQVTSYYMFRRIDLKFHRSYENDPWLNTGRKVESLGAFYSVLNDVLTPAA
jgi:DNA invertase Pin-like site-specific DNA recombinase